MKALVAQELSGPAGLVYTDVEDPADVVDSGMVVVDVGVAGVSFPDLLLIKGEYQLKLNPPFVPGTEVAGVVRSAPADSGFAVGQRVTGLSMLGAWAERVALLPASVQPTPDEIDDGAAVCLLGNYYTMYFALVRRGGLLAGETVLVLGSAGGVGTAAIQIAKALGARVIAMVHRPGATEFVESLGADVVLPLTDGWAQAVRDHTDGRGVDVVVDPVGGEAFDDAIRVLATEGRLLVLGFASGGGIPSVKVNRLLLRNVSVVGVGLGEFINRTPGAQAEIGAGLGKLVAAGLRPPPPVRYPLSEGRAALESLADSGIRGKVVLVP
ncbi:NADPH:quinone oxidoreductase family protein [Mycolicibacterium sp. P9-64]|uniref:NADPH:quinone oxidoreductase family protein n=1 Tax=Mycolicibacterium sp. P9-64 TaxID=2024612 RepID=UPI0011EDA1AA|nr:NADPH:quinone oxidoreductase family protein [Mycolicibacterium sp. P9-64]KAA0079677.1 NADPH:quinone oxidoreductase family protein [Mycolicibacterium sp. P9-64]